MSAPVGNALARAHDGAARVGEMQSWAVAEQRVRDLIERADAEMLDEARRQAEAAALYEKRAHNQERSDHFMRLKLLAEAALGVLALDCPDLVDQKDRGQFTALAAAFERGRLWAMIDAAAESGSVNPSRVENRVRNEGYTSVPGDALGDPRESIPWREARVIARAQGVAHTSLPPDRAAVAKRNQASFKRAQQMRALWRAKEKTERDEQRTRITSAAQARGKKTVAAWALLRRTLAALHQARAEADTRTERERIDDAMFALYGAEDELALSLGVAHSSREEIADDAVRAIRGERNGTAAS